MFGRDRPDRAGQPDPGWRDHLLRPGVEIGPNALVGAGAVVTRNVLAGVVAYGVPAYAQRDRSPEEIEATGPADQS